MISLSSCHLSFHYLVLLGYTRVHFRLVIYIVVTLDVYIYVPVTQRITLLKPLGQLRKTLQIGDKDQNGLASSWIRGTF